MRVVGGACVGVDGLGTRAALGGRGPGGGIVPGGRGPGGADAMVATVLGSAKTAAPGGRGPGGGDRMAVAGPGGVRLAVPGGCGFGAGLGIPSLLAGGGVGGGGAAMEKCNPPPESGFDRSISVNSCQACIDDTRFSVAAVTPLQSVNLTQKERH